MLFRSEAADEAARQATAQLARAADGLKKLEKDLGPEPPEDLPDLPDLVLDAPEPKMGPTAVDTAVAEERQIPVVIRATGTFVPDESSEVTPQVAGTVTQTLVQVGDVVKAGAIIVTRIKRDLTGYRSSNLASPINVKVISIRIRERCSPGIIREIYI